jgi:DNA polymerase sigma
MFLYSDPPPSHHPPSDWLRLFFKPNLFPYKHPNILKPSHTSYLPAYEDGTFTVFQTLALKLQTPVNNPEESTRHSEHGESLKSRIINDP